MIRQSMKRQFASIHNGGVHVFTIKAYRNTIDLEICKAIDNERGIYGTEVLIPNMMKRGKTAFITQDNIIFHMILNRNGHTWTVTLERTQTLNKGVVR